jgi:hypothetical protein
VARAAETAEAVRLLPRVAAVADRSKAATQARPSAAC